MSEAIPSVRLGTVATVKARLGWKGLKAEEYVSEGCFFLATPDIKTFEINFEGANLIPRWRYDESPEIQLQIGDVLLVKDGSTLGIANLVRRLPGPTTVNGSIAVVRPGEGLHSEYLFQTMQGSRFQELIRLKRSGLGVPHLFQADLREFEFTCPDLSDQRQVAAILGTVDDAIRKTEEIIAKLKQVKHGLLHDLLSRGIDDNGEVRDPERHPEQFTDSQLGRIPRNWLVSRLAGCLVSSPQNGLYKPFSYYGESGTPIVRIDGFYDGVMKSLSTFKRVRLSSNEVQAYRLNEGEILVNRVNVIDYVGKVALVPEVSEPVVFESNIMRLRLARERLDPAFATLSLCAGPARRHFFRRAKSAIAQASVNQSDVNELLLALPGIDEQRLVASRLGEVEDRLGFEALAIAKLRLLKSGLVEDLLTGRVRVTHLADSP